jgi:hypothetical protein
VRLVFLSFFFECGRFSLPSTLPDFLEGCVAKVFRRSSPPAAYADRKELIWLQRQNCFDADQMPPLVVEIVFVEEIFFDAQAEVGKFDSPRVITKSDPAEGSNAVLFVVNKEAVKMVTGPAKGDL